HRKNADSLRGDVEQIERPSAASAVAVIDAQRGKFSAEGWTKIPSADSSADSAAAATGVAVKSIVAHGVRLHILRRQIEGNQLSVDRLLPRGGDRVIPEPLEIRFSIQ